jgi:glycosyltransferase involved in cell wall biosynthesis
MIQAMQEIHPHDSKYQWQQYGIAELPELQQKEEIIFSNRLHEKLYNIDRIIEYFIEFNKEHPTWKLIVAGSGNETENLKSLVNKSIIGNAVEFKGWLSPEENAYWYSKSKIYISIPKSDGTAISMLEALAHGCLPVLPNLPVTKEWIVDGKTGIIQKENSNPLSEAITLLDEDYASVNRAKIKTLAIRKECGQAYFELYKRIGRP